MLSPPSFLCLPTFFSRWFILLIWKTETNRSTHWSTPHGLQEQDPAAGAGPGGTAKTAGVSESRARAQASTPKALTQVSICSQWRGPPTLSVQVQVPGQCVAARATPCLYLKRPAVAIVTGWRWAHCSCRPVVSTLAPAAPCRDTHAPQPGCFCPGGSHTLSALPLCPPPGSSWS